MSYGQDAILRLNSWAGTREYRILIVGETKKYWRFVAQEAIRMPSGQLLAIGDASKAPKSAINILGIKP